MSKTICPFIQSDEGNWISSQCSHCELFDHENNVCAFIVISNSIANIVNILRDKKEVTNE